MPVTTEKRPRGKTVTLISNVRGDKGELIQMLKQALGCGGRAVAHDTVEIQGDHADAIQGLLLRHVGVGAMRGVAGLKPPKPDPAELAAELHETARRQARAKSAEALAAERRRRLEQRQRAIREAVPAKHENTREFHAFASMMKRWRYWDQDYAHPLERASERGGGGGIPETLRDEFLDLRGGAHGNHVLGQHVVLRLAGERRELRGGPLKHVRVRVRVHARRRRGVRVSRDARDRTTRTTSEL